MPRGPFVALVFLAATSLAVAQETEAPRPTSFSQPLESHTLETLFPVRGEADLEQQVEIGRRWQAVADILLDLARQREKAATGQLGVKQAEVQSLKVRRKAAKKGKAADELAAAESLLVAETHQVKALQAVRELAVAERRVATAWSEAGRLLTQAAEAEAVFADRRATLAATQDVGSRWSSVDPTTWEHARRYNEAIRGLALRLTEAGQRLEELTERRRRVLEEWKPRSGR